MKVTAETITDEQLRELLMDPKSPMALRRWASVALDEFGFGSKVERKRMRDRCAAAWNARHGGWPVRRGLSLATARLLVGRRIVAVDLHAERDLSESGRHIKWVYDPVFTLDNGARVTFTVDEIDSGDGYKIRPNYHPRNARHGGGQ